MRMRLAVGLMAAAVIAGCAPRAAAPEADTPLTNVEWVLTWIEGADVPPEPTVSFIIEEGGRVSGHAGVNRYFTTANIDAEGKGTLELATIGATRMAGPPARMALERDYLERLARVTRYTISGRTLTLSEGGSALLRYRVGP